MAVCSCPQLDAPNWFSFDEWAANNSVNEPGAWASKAATAVGRYTNFPSGFRAASRRGEVCRFCVA